MRGASERPCAARVSLQLWLAVRKEQAKAAKLEKAAIGRFFDTLKGRRIMRRPFPASCNVSLFAHRSVQCGDEHGRPVIHPAFRLFKRHCARQQRFTR